jgi:membrane protein YdbS with pleckstrin-like domain
VNTDDKGGYDSQEDQEADMALILLVLLLAILFGGLGFILHALWWVAVVVAVVWLIGFVVRAGEGRRWYRW